ncbi:uncharacterized protein LOC118437307 [Folsomia candida]|uniref:uncharacterized protein LOC118437307 n=1 Tax=Folsomia candida TaxID=158441 RepID=UPI001604FE61|nr:uncharacterized protein LOC118437307 [Folsomia candida]
MESSCGSGEGAVEPKLEFTNVEECFHKNLVKLYRFRQFFEPQTLKMQTIIEMELCGPTLTVFLNDSADKSRKIQGFKNLHLFQVQIGQGMIEGMRYLHNQNVLHRDLKPGNIFFTRPNDGDFYELPIKIGDFGLSKHLIGREVKNLPGDCDDNNKDQFDLTLERGTLAYRAPEVDCGVYGKQADIYSLGLTFWEIFQDLTPNRNEMFAKLQDTDPSHLIREHPIISNLKPLIISMTQLNPANRLKSMSDVTLISGREESTIHVTTSDEFTTILATCCQEVTIFLTAGEYLGPFLLSQERVIIQGETDENFNNLVIIRMPPELESFSDLFTLQADYCELKNLSFQRARSTYDKTGFVLSIPDGTCTLENITISGGTTGLRFGGICSTATNITVTDCAQCAIIVAGWHQTLENIVVTNTASGISFNDTVKHVKLSDVQLKGVQIGVEVWGEGHEIRNVTLENCEESISKMGMYTLSGKHCIIDNFTICPELKRNGSDFQGLLFGSRSDSIVVSNSRCGPIELDGVGHTLINVDVQEFLQITGSSHRLDNCKGKVLRTFECYYTTVEDNCNFDHEEHK